MKQTPPAQDKIRTRYPPSPTGALHLGGARTALFNWLFARHHGGRFVLRLEDTDRERSKPEHVDSILQAMDWLGLDCDEGPYYQTRRFERYREVIDQLLDAGKAYWCHCTPSELEEQRAAARARGDKPLYARVCRERGLGPAPGAVVRFRGPREGSTVVPDLIKGPIEFQHAELDDLVILRSDGTPTYHLAVVVDDIDMHISHVIRGDDHVNNTPRQMLLYQAIGVDLPHFAHLPMVLGPDKARLSKRHGATDVMAYQKMGVLPEALVNALARLGWSHGDQEIFSRQELIDYFDLASVGKSAAVFDAEKLAALNAHYIQEAPAERLAELARPFLAARGIENLDMELLKTAIPELKPRAKYLTDLVDWADPFLRAEPQMDPKAAKKFLKPANAEVLRQVARVVEQGDPSDQAAMEAAFGQLCSRLEVGLGKVAQPTRVALMGRTYSPGIFEVMAILGKERVLARLARAIERAQGQGSQQG